MQQITTTVFPLAGFGTRFLPATKAMPKELLPVVDKPLVQYAVEEAIDAGVETLIFVTGRNKRAIEDHFDNNFELDRFLRAKGQNTKADLIKNIPPNNVSCIFVRQPAPRGLGDAILCAEKLLANEPFAVILADDFLVDEKVNATRELIQGYLDTGRSQISVMEINGPAIEEYGVVIPCSSRGGIKGLVEKPKLAVAPSNLASIGRYVLDKKIFEILKEIPMGRGGELQLADAINTLAGNGNVEIQKYNGLRFDCGSIDGFVMANNHVFQNRDIKK